MRWILLSLGIQFMVSALDITENSRNDVDQSLGAKKATIVQIYLFAKNEEVLLPHAVHHYRTRFPGCPITVYDHNSTDATATLAERLGCTVQSRMTKDDIQDNADLARLKNMCWKTNYEEDRDPPWVIVADIDEWLDLWQRDLEAEDASGSMIIRTQGFAALGNSTRLDLADIDLHGIQFGTRATFQTISGLFKIGNVRLQHNFNWYSKLACFKRGHVGLSECNFTPGAHMAKPVPLNATVTSNCYVLKHMNALGLPYLTRKHELRYKQTTTPGPRRQSYHYSNDLSNAVQIYNYMTRMSTYWTCASARDGCLRMQCAT